MSNLLNEVDNEEYENHILEAALQNREAVLTNTGQDFTGHLCGLQVNVPSDLRESIRLLAYKQGRSMAEIVFSCLTSQELIRKSWVSTKQTKKEDL